MSVAHEVAHLLLHYITPRQEAVIAFGTRILAVLDRTRPPTLGERLSSTLRDVPIEPFRHAMDRGQCGYAGRVTAMEDEADDLAIELLAPRRELRSLRDASPGAIRERFGVPASVATWLAEMARPPKTSVGVVGLFQRK